MGIFNLTRKIKTCNCGKSKGLYIDNLNAEYEGNCRMIGFANGSFRQAFSMQELKDKKLVNKNECCKGTEFEAFFIPKNATSINKTDE